MRSKWFVLFSVVVLGAIALVAVTHPEQTREFSRSLASLSLTALATALLLILMQVSFQALRLWAIIPGDSSLSFLRTGYIFTVGDWTNIFVPARGGDALKVVWMSRPERGRRMSLARATGAMLADKVVDVGTLILLCAFAGLMSVLALGTRAALPSPGIIIGTAAGLVLFLTWVWRGSSPWMTARRVELRELLGGQSGLKDPVRCSASVSFCIASRISEVVALGVLCGALGFRLSPPQLLLALVTVNLSVMVPVSFANLGLYEAGLAYGLTRSGVPLPIAITIATTHHALELLGITLSAAGYAFASQVRLRGALAATVIPLLDEPAPKDE